MSKRSRGVGLLLGLAVLAGALANAGPEPANPNKAVAEAQLKLARQVLQQLDRLSKGGALPITDPAFALWERRQIQAIRDAGASKAEIVAALEAYLKRMKDYETVARSNYQRGGISSMDQMEAQYRTLEAEMWLNTEKAR